MFDFLIQGFDVALSPLNLGLAFLGAVLGTLFGALPGIGPINGIAILMPLAYTLGLPAESALILLAGVYTGAEYGGRMSSILLNVPGDAGAVMTALDGHPLAKKGLAGPALGLSAVSSFVGATIAIIGLTLFAPMLARIAVMFGPAEFFALMVFAFASMAVMMGKDPIKTGIAAVLGVLIAMVGVDSGTGVMRYTFGLVELYDGIDFVVMIIGLFAISEILLMLEHGRKADADEEMPAVGRVLVSLKEVLHCRWAMIRSGLIGFIVGVLPGTGASVAGAVSYTTEKRISDKDDTFGTGDMGSRQQCGRSRLLCAHADPGNPRFRDHRRAAGGPDAVQHYAWPHDVLRTAGRGRWPDRVPVCGEPDPAGAEPASGWSLCQGADHSPLGSGAGYCHSGICGRVSVALGPDGHLPDADHRCLWLWPA